MALPHRVPAPVIPAPGQPLDPQFIANYGKPAGLWTPSQAGGTTAYDFSGNGNNGTLNGGVTTLPVGWGTLAQSWGFNGTSGYINLGTSSLLCPTGSFTICVQFTYKSSGPYILFSRDDVGANRSYALNVNTNQIQWQPSGSSVLFPQVLSPGTNYVVHLVGISGTAFKCYLNGVLNGSAAWQAINTTTTSTLIGARGGASPSLFLNGTIGYVDFRNFPLTAAQISALYSTLMYGVP